MRRRRAIRHRLVKSLRRSRLSRMIVKVKASLAVPSGSTFVRARNQCFLDSPLRLLHQLLCRCLDRLTRPLNRLLLRLMCRSLDRLTRLFNELLHQLLRGALACLTYPTTCHPTCTPTCPRSYSSINPLTSFAPTTVRLTWHLLVDVRSPPRRLAHRAALGSIRQRSLPPNPVLPTQAALSMLAS